MRTFAQKQKAAQQTTSAKSAIPGRTHFGQSREVSAILHLQRTIGNQAVQRLLQASAEEHEEGLFTRTSPRFAHDFSRIRVHANARTNILPRLKVSSPGDVYEQEADRIADQVMHMPDPQFQRTCACGAVCPRCRMGQVGHQDSQAKQGEPEQAAKALVPPVVNGGLRSSGRPIDSATREFMESRFGHDFSRVRVHTDRKATGSAEAMNAMAYTMGQDVVFGDGKYAPATGQGRRLIAHELAHVVQASRNGAQAIHRMATDEQGAEAALVGPVMPETTEPAPTELEGPPESATPQSSGPGPSGGKPDPSLPDCTAVMGGRQVDYWAAKIVRAQHTFMNFKLDSSNYWLVEAGPLPSDPKKSGAWAKFGDWDTRGERARKTFGKEDCTAMKDCLLDTTTKYHAAGVTYNPTSGPNSNSFMEHLTFKCKDLPKSFISKDIAWDYWTKNPRPF
jgi:hypothetical protein